MKNTTNLLLFLSSILFFCCMKQDMSQNNQSPEPPKQIVTSRTACPPCDACLAIRNSCYTDAENNFWNNVATMGATGSFTEGWRTWSSEKIYSSVDPTVEIGETWTLGESKVVKKGSAGPVGTYYVLETSGYNNAWQILQQSKAICDDAYNNCLP
jgi:hypothetical protein